MDPIKNIEASVALTVSVFQLQIATLTFIGSSRFRGQIINQMKALADSLRKQVESMEQEVLGAIESGTEYQLGMSAGFLNSLVEAREHDAPIPDELVELAKAGHRQVTATLSGVEKAEEEKTIARFAAVKQKIKLLEEQIKRL